MNVTTPLVQPLAGDSNRYQLVADYPFEAFSRDWTIAAGFVFDGASVPSVIGLSWAMTYAKTDSRVMPAALVHDYFCVHKPVGTNYKGAADLFKQMLIAYDASSFKASIMHRAVLLGGPKWGEEPEVSGYYNPDDQDGNNDGRQ